MTIRRRAHHPKDGPLDDEEARAYLAAIELKCTFLMPAVELFRPRLRDAMAMHYQICRAYGGDPRAVLEYLAGDEGAIEIVGSLTSTLMRTKEQRQAAHGMEVAV